MQLKSNSAVVLSDFVVLMEKQFLAKIKTIRTDNGKEFLNEFCRNLFMLKGIVHQTTCVYTPQHNSVTERKHKHALNITRYLKFKNVGLDRYWGEGILTTCYLINLTLHVL